MYRELGAYLHRMVTRKEIWTDGDLWTAVALGTAVGWWSYCSPHATARVRAHFPQLLTVTGTIFGFASTSLVFYVQSTATWSPVEWVQGMARKIVDWYVWTVFCLLVLLAYILAIWAVPAMVQFGARANAVGYGLLGFLVAYVGGLIVNNTLTIWWGFNHRDELKEGKRVSSAALAQRKKWPRWLVGCMYSSAMIPVCALVMAWVWLQLSWWGSMLVFVVATIFAGLLALAGIGSFGLLAARSKPESATVAPVPSNGGTRGGDGNVPAESRI